MVCASIPEWITATVAVLGAPFALFQYWRSQQWLRTEWVGKQFDAFLDDPRVFNALLMLDWKERDLPLLLPVDTSVKKYVYKQEMLERALAVNDGPYSDVEQSIRDCFDRFLGGLERFGSFMEEGLISRGDVARYLEYWLDIIGDTSNCQKSDEARRAIWGYIKKYEYAGVVALLETFGYNV